MTWKLDASGLSAIDLIEGKPGTVFVLADQMGRDLIPMLMLPEADGFIWAIELAGPNAFELRSGGRKTPDNAFMIPLWKGDYEVELPKTLRSDGGKMESPGSLVVSPLGTFMTIRRQVDGFTRSAYVSLYDWSIVERPGRPVTTFSKWRLNLAGEGSELRRTLLEIGDWSETS